MDTKSFVVIGLGRFGSSVAKEFSKLGHEVLVIDEDAEKVQEVADLVTHAVVGDAKDEMVLNSIGVRNFDGVIIAMGENLEDSVLTTLMLKEMGVSNIVCKARNDQHKKVLEKVGADRVVVPEQEMGRRLAQTLVFSNVLDFINLSNDVNVFEFKAPATWAGKSITELDIRKKYNINILALRKGEEIMVSPPPHCVIGGEDILVAVGTTDCIVKLKGVVY
ncbi:TrkA family potassium uptake protein [Oscillospiraceae bacterium OttesenSCG-928-G22]|nr:TrkA family potassium uptake protein [Oscillospiraceae bacterium OttesenSCG-928-G22]